MLRHLIRAKISYWLSVLEKQRLEETSCLTSGFLVFCECPTDPTHTQRKSDPILQVSWCQMKFWVAGEKWSLQPWRMADMQHATQYVCPITYFMKEAFLWAGRDLLTPTHTSLQHGLELSSWSAADSQWNRDHDIIKYFSLIHLGAVQITTATKDNMWSFISSLDTVEVFFLLVWL